MIFHETELIIESREYAIDILQQIPKEFYYHNLMHTQDVVSAAIEIGENSGLKVQQLEEVVVAAWFHDLGYSNNIDDHEEESIIMMEEKMVKWKVPYDRIDVIANIIRSTKIPQTPTNLQSKVMCDADLYHLADAEYEEKSEALRKELNSIKHLDLTEREWYEMSIEFLSKHNYFTDYAQQSLRPKKLRNLEMLKKQI